MNAPAFGVIVPEIDREGSVGVIEIESARPPQHAQAFADELDPLLELAGPRRHLIARLPLLVDADVLQQAAAKDDVELAVTKRQPGGIAAQRPNA